MKAAAVPPHSTHCSYTSHVGHTKVVSATVARPLEEVFDRMTTPGYWPLYSPITLGVEVDDPWKPLAEGDKCREHIRVHAWHGHIDMRVEKLERPYRCEISGAIAGDHVLSHLALHEPARIEITLAEEDGTTRITRSLSYSGLAAIIENLNPFGSTVDDACETAMEALVSALENPYQHGPQSDVTAESLIHEADPLADAAVASLVPPSGDLGALEAFLGNLYRGDPPPATMPDAMRTFLASTSELPVWACRPYINEASKIFLEWGLLSVAAHICASLPETYQIARTAKLLNLTQQLDRDPTHADRRLWFTVRMCFDVLDQNGLNTTGGHGIIALQRLRLLHAMVRMFVQHRLKTPHRLSGLSSNGLWDTENGQPISQVELLYTLLTFSHVVVRSFDIWECGLTPFQKEAYIHIWNVAGAMLGIHPELLPRNTADAARMFEEIKARYGAATPEAIKLGGALVTFWADLFPKVARNEAMKLMQYVVSTLLSPETAKINGFDELPDYSPAAADTVRGCVKVGTRICREAFTDVPASREAASLVVSLLIRKFSQPYEDDSGIFDIPDMLYASWIGIPSN